jgi:hypothetical protein
VTVDIATGLRIQEDVIEIVEGAGRGLLRSGGVNNPPPSRCDQIAVFHIALSSYPSLKQWWRVER